MSPHPGPPAFPPAEIDWSWLDWDWLSLDWSMRSVYIVCALVGGTVLVVQTLLLLFGLGGDEAEWDGAADADDGSFGVLSVRSLASFLAFFGLSGWGALEAGWGRFVSLAVAVAAGLAIMVVVAWLMRLQLRLQSSGNLDPRGAIGRTATVYLRIPARGAGRGKITLALQGRTAEFEAVSGGPEIPTGGVVRILSMPTPGTFEVVPLSEE